MRGKEPFITDEVLDSGITPAYAGKSRGIDAHKRPDWDHPRVCGEKGSRYREQIYSLGSPPRMRGKAVENKVNEPQFRITPAYAGKSTCPLLTAGLHKDHPRVCGEKHSCESVGTVS